MRIVCGIVMSTFRKTFEHSAYDGIPRKNDNHDLTSNKHSALNDFTMIFENWPWTPKFLGRITCVHANNHLFIDSNFKISNDLVIIFGSTQNNFSNGYSTLLSSMLFLPQLDHLHMHHFQIPIVFLFLLLNVPAMFSSCLTVPRKNIHLLANPHAYLVIQLGRNKFE